MTDAMQISMESIRQRDDPYQLFEDYLKNPNTRRKYRNFLFRFLRSIPQEVFKTSSAKLAELTRMDEKKLVEIFVDLARNDTPLAKNIIAAYIKEKNKLVDEGKINPNYIPNLIKPIHALLDANGIPIHWKSLYKLFPRAKKTNDRAYAKEEIQQMLEVSTNITDKVIILLFSSAGFRLESWDYFVWDDIRFFKNIDSFKGGAIRVYREDPEEYWSCFTPETARMLQLYREYWKSKTGSYPADDDPLLRSDRFPVTHRLNAFGVKRRLEKIVKRIGLRNNYCNGSNRYEVPLDHGFRKYFNTMLRRAKVDYLDKEDMMGHSVGLEKHYERYNEEDFERFPEYQKAIPFLTISDREMLLLKNQQLTEERSQLEKRIPQMVKEAVERVKDDLKKEGWQST